MNTTFHQLANIPPDVLSFWRDSALAQDPVSAFARSPEWCRLMAGEDPAQSTVAVARDADGQINLVLPLLHRPWPLNFGIGSRRIFGKSLNTLKVAGGDLAVGSGQGAVGSGGSGVWDAIFACHPAIDAIGFEHLGDEARFDLLKSTCHGKTFAHAVFERLPHYRLLLPETLEECLALRSAKSRQRLRGKERALARETGSQSKVIEIRAPDDWGPHEAVIDELMNRSWQAQLLGQTFKLDNFRGVAEAGWLRGFLLLCGDRAVAFTLYYQGMNTLISGVLGYDRALSRFSPGALLFTHTLERLYADNRPAYLDFGEGDADYKQQWANDQIKVGALLIVRKRPALQALLTAQRLWSRSEAVARAVLKTTGADRWLRRTLKGQQDAQHNRARP